MMHYLIRCRELISSDTDDRGTDSAIWRNSDGEKLNCERQEIAYL